MKQLYVISTGRCGTKRLAEILRGALDPEHFSVEHQVAGSRLANVLGNLMYFTGPFAWLKRRLHRKLLRRYALRENFISTDPLTAMILPPETVTDPDVMIVHVERDAESFAKSFFSLSRQRAKSFIAHNFIPLWQPGVWPLENLLNRHILRKYEQVWARKNQWFERQYATNPHYVKLPMEALFEANVLAGIIEAHFGVRPGIPEDALQRRSNQSMP